METAQQAVLIRFSSVLRDVKREFGQIMTDVWGFVNLPRRMSLFKLKQNGIEFLYSTHRAVDANAKVPMLRRTRCCRVEAM